MGQDISQHGAAPEMEMKIISLPHGELHFFASLMLKKGYLDPQHVQHESYQVESPINKGLTKREFENLHKFFALLVDAPWLERVIRAWLLPLLTSASRMAFCRSAAWWPKRPARP